MMRPEFQKWVVDECEDASGNYTIRLDDGTPNGNTEEPPIATVYNSVMAEFIVAEHNTRLSFMDI